MPSIPQFHSFANESFSDGPKGLGHPHKTFVLKLTGERPIQAMATIFCDDGAVLMLVRPTKSDDLELFADKGFQSKLEKHVIENLSRGIILVRDHDRGGTLFEFTEPYFQVTLDHLF